MTDSNNIKLTADARTALKKAIYAHPGYAAMPEAGSSNRNWTKAEILAIAARLGIDVAPYATMTAQVVPLHAAPAAANDGAAISTEDAEQQAAAILAMPLAARVSAVADLVVRAATPVEKVIEIEKVVERIIEVPVASGDTAVASGTVPAPHWQPTITRVSAASLFPVLAGMSEGTWQVEIYGDPTAPKIDPAYVWRPQVLVPFLAALLTGENAWLSGDASTGKTSLAQQVAAVTRRAFARVNFNRATTQDDLLGSMGVANGTTFWQDGSITTAIQRPGCIVVLDEVTNTRPANHAAMQAVLERDGALVISTIGRTVRRAPGVIFVAADNTNGRGDETGLYLDTLEVNAAFRDRFACSIAVPYMDTDPEARVLQARTGMTLKVTRMLTRFADKCRAARAAGNLREPVTHRTMVAWAEALKLGMSPGMAFEIYVAGKATIIDAEALRQLYTTHIDPVKLQEALGIDTDDDTAPDATADTSVLDNAGTAPDLAF